MADLSALEKQARARVGSTLNAKWRLDAFLGVGGMGAVFAATNRNGWRGAIKIMHADLALVPRARGRFLSEGKIANTVDHPGRVAVLDDDVSDLGEPFLIMDLLEGETLMSRVRRSGGGLGMRETLRIFDAVLDLLAACHAAKVIHRDVKPSNVFITETGEVKVLDFGVARARPHDGAERTRSGVALGTASYMAPEQAMGLPDVDARADLFSVGACIFSALTSLTVHPVCEEKDSILVASTARARSLAVVAPSLPAELAAFVDKSLAFDREDRHPDALSMRFDLSLLLLAVEAGVLRVQSGQHRAVRALATDPATIRADVFAAQTRRTPEEGDTPAASTVVDQAPQPQSVDIWAKSRLSRRLP